MEELWRDKNHTKQRAWRRGWESNPRMEVLQTSPLGHLGTAPRSISITKLACRYKRNRCPRNHSISTPPALKSTNLQVKWHADLHQLVGYARPAKNGLQ